MMRTAKICEGLLRLVSLAKGRGTEQGVKTFSGFADLLARLSSEEEEKRLVKLLYQNLAGFQRFADLTTQEDGELTALIRLCETYMSAYSER